MSKSQKSTTKRRLYREEGLAGNGKRPRLAFFRESRWKLPACEFSPVREVGWDTEFTVFSFLLFCASLPEVTDSPQRDPDGAARSNKRVRILVVDDSPYILETLISFFKQHQEFDLVGTAIDGHQALRRVRALEPDLILMDVQLPGISGLEATRRIKACKSNSVVIMMTADDTPGCRAAAKAAGADGFVGKAGDMFTKLQSAIRRVFPEARL